uniref:CSON010113 protein n=1 Tax=Culicoides sonorensis TaxID=179676 RepID=A0A336LKS1_CULSO
MKSNLLILLQIGIFCVVSSRTVKRQVPQNPNQANNQGFYPGFNNNPFFNNPFQFPFGQGNPAGPQIQNTGNQQPVNCQQAWNPFLCQGQPPVQNPFNFGGFNPFGSVQGPPVQQQTPVQQPPVQEQTPVQQPSVQEQTPVQQPPVQQNQEPVYVEQTQPNQDGQATQQETSDSEPEIDQNLINDIFNTNENQ